MCYKLQNRNSVFFLPYVYMDSIQQIVFLEDDYFEAGLLHQIFYETDDGVLRKRIQSDNGCILDIGANIGNHTLYFANELHAKRIIAFEPVRETYRILKKNVALNKLDNAVELHNIGISDESGMASIRNEYNYENIGGTGLSTGEGNLQLKTIDELCVPCVSFIKIDVEGMELKVLRGAKETIKRDMPYIMIESFPKRYSEVKEYLKSLGYTKWYDFGVGDHLYVNERE